MRTIKSISSIRHAIKKIKSKNQTIGFVPTMGALHEGHLSLLRRARRENDLLVMSIFVNPSQFGPHEDFTRYPRQKKKDHLFAKKEKVDIIFYPSDEEMYPMRSLTTIATPQLIGKLCGKFRPGHFQGVTTVVGKLLNIVTPDTLYLGQKDAQQSIILRQMVRDLNFDVKIKVCPTVREKDGLALSSRNQHLSKAQRPQASILFRSLKQAKQMILAGERNSKKIVKAVRSMIENNSSAKIQYVECVEAETLSALNRIQGKVMIALAAIFGKTRLIDNIIFQVS